MKQINKITISTCIKYFISIINYGQGQDKEIGSISACHKQTVGFHINQTTYNIKLVFQIAILCLYLNSSNGLGPMTFNYHFLFSNVLVNKYVQLGEICKACMISKRNFKKRTNKILTFLCGNFDPLIKLNFEGFDAGVFRQKYVIIQFQKNKEK